MTSRFRPNEIFQQNIYPTDPLIADGIDNDCDMMTVVDELAKKLA